MKKPKQRELTLEGTGVIVEGVDEEVKLRELTLEGIGVTMEEVDEGGWKD